MGGLILVVAVLASQVRVIVAAKYPRLRAITALAVSAPLLIVVFAASDYLMAARDRPASCSLWIAQRRCISP